MIQKGLSTNSFKPLTRQSINKIHHTVMRVIEEVGFEIHSEMAVEAFEQAGAWVDKERQQVRLPRAMAMDLIRRAPSRVQLCGQEERHDAILGRNRVYAGTGGTALYIYEPATGQRRPATLQDLKRIARLVDKLDNIHIFMLPTYPSEVPVERVDVNRFFAGLDNTTKHIMGGIYTLDGVNQVVRMAELVAGSSEALHKRPLVSMVACSISPLKMDREYGDLIIAIAQSGIPLVCPAEPLCGATSPVTLAGNLVIQTADSLLGVMLAQIVRPGTPVILGSVASNTDFRDLKYQAGSVEMGLLNAAGAQIAQFYQLPFYGTGGMTDSKTLDAQSGYESAITTLLCALAGANFIHDAAGLMEFALTACDEKYVIDNEIIGMAMRAVQGITVNEETLAFDLIKEVGPGGNFVTAPHTRRHLRTEHYQPYLSNKDSREEWEARGKKTTWERAGEVAERLIAEDGYSLPPPIRRQILSEITGIVE